MENQPIRSCCFVYDRSLIVIIVSALIVLCGVSLSIYKLIVEKDCNNTTPYYILLTNTASLAAGVLFGMSKKKVDNQNENSVRPGFSPRR